MQRDIVVIGASRGGVAALSLLVSDLPCDLAASLFVVLHIRPDVPGCLAAILSQPGRLPAMYATNLQPIEPRHIRGGVGRALLAHAVAEGRQRVAERVTIPS